MKKTCLFIVLCLVLQSLFANQLSTFVNQFKASGFVNDYANLLSEDKVEALEAKIAGINDSTSIQFAILTLQSLEDYTAKEVAEEVANFWGVGQKELNNGILILASVRERAIHIALGEGTDDYVTNEYIKTLIKQVVKPAFKKGKYARGINDAIEKIYMQLSGTNLDSRVIEQKRNYYWLAGILGILIITAMLFWLIKRK